MKTIISFLLLAVVNLIHCQEHDQMIVFTLQGVLEKLEGINDKLKGFEAVQQKQEEIMDKLMGAVVNNQDSLQNVQQKLGNLDTNLQGLHRELEHVKGAVVNNQESLQRLSRETGQCLRGDDLQHLTNVSSAAHQEIKSFVHEEISGVISLAEKDECSEGSPPCGELGNCTNTLFSFTCSCPPGFTWDGSDCADIDECFKGKADCNSIGGICENTLGSYSCSCNPPFKGDGRTCSCPPQGFVLNGDICEDIDECAEGEGVCSPNAICNNSIGSYSCSCNKAFEGDGITSCELHCQSPAKVIRGLGCIKRVEEDRTHPEMEDFCRAEGGRLLQHFDARGADDVLNAFLYSGMWIGVYDEKWTSDESLVPKDLWEEGYRSDPSKRCGILARFSSSSYKVTQIDCSSKGWGFCQFHHHHHHHQLLP